VIAPLRIGRTEDFTPVYIKANDRNRHVFVDGSTGGGKTNILKSFWYQDCLLPVGKILIDPSNSFAREAYSMSKNAVYSSLTSPIGINPLMLPYDANDICDILIESINQVIELLTENVLLTVRMRSILRDAIVFCVRNNRKRLDLVVDYLNSMKVNHETRQSLIDRINLFIQDERMHQMLCELPPIDWNDVITNKRTFIMDCHGMNEDKMIFIGTLITQQIKTYFRYTKKDKHQPLVLYIDECHNFVNQNTFSVLREGRKYNISAILATTDFSGLNDKLVHTILSNVGTLITFRCGYREAVQLYREFRQLKLEDIQFAEKHYCAYRTPDAEGIAKTNLAPYVKKKEIVNNCKPMKTKLTFKWFELKPCRQPEDSEPSQTVSANTQGQGVEIPLSLRTDSYQ
jgi:type IV secretory pathway VirB4 component